MGFLSDFGKLLGGPVPPELQATLDNFGMARTPLELEQRKLKMSYDLEKRRNYIEEMKQMRHMLSGQSLQDFFKNGDPQAAMQYLLQGGDSDNINTLLELQKQGKRQGAVEDFDTKWGGNGAQGGAPPIGLAPIPGMGQSVLEMASNMRSGLPVPPMPTSNTVHTPAPEQPFQLSSSRNGGPASRPSSPGQQAMPGGVNAPVSTPGPAMTPFPTGAMTPMPAASVTPEKLRGLHQQMLTATARLTEAEGTGNPERINQAKALKAQAEFDYNQANDLLKREADRANQVIDANTARTQKLEDAANNPENHSANAAGFYEQMVNAEMNMYEPARSGQDSSSVLNRVVESIPLAGRYLTSSDYQQSMQAQQAWVRAKLRRESGATITPEEMEAEIKTYFPQPGDSDATKEQKRQSRLVAQNAMQRSAGMALNNSQVPTYLQQKGFTPEMLQEYWAIKQSQSGR